MRGSRWRSSPTAARGTAKRCGRCRRSPTRGSACRSARPASSIPKASGCVADENAFAIGATMAGHYGAATHRRDVRRDDVRRAWNVQGDARRPEFVDAVRDALRALASVAPNTTARDGALHRALARSRVVARRSRRTNRTLADFESRRDALNAAGGALFDVSASRVAWTDRRRACRDRARQGVPAGLPSARLCRGGLRAERLRARQCALLPARRRPRVHADGRAELRARRLARACLSAAAFGYDVLLARDF